MLNFEEILQSLIYVVPAIIIALTFHEYAHAKVANAFGDPTAKDMGRLTLNPLKHLDPIGTLVLIIANFGWAKPVPVNDGYFEGNRKRKMLFVALAGPLTNLLQAVVGAVLLSLALSFLTYSDFSNYLVTFLNFYVTINVVLAVLNLLPIPPLDGSKILGGLLPDRFYKYIALMDRYGFIVLIILAVSGLLSKILIPIVDFIVEILYSITFII
jgi:Zn-dependent protease